MEYARANEYVPGTGLIVWAAQPGESAQHAVPRRTALMTAAACLALHARCVHIRSGRLVVIVHAQWSVSTHAAQSPTDLAQTLARLCLDLQFSWVSDSSRFKPIQPRWRIPVAAEGCCRFVSLLPVQHAATPHARAQ